MRQVLATLLTLVMLVSANLPLIVVVGGGLLFWRQFTGRRSARWSRRWYEWYAPFGLKVAADARAIRATVAAPFRRRQAVREADVDAAIRDILGGGADR